MNLAPNVSFIPNLAILAILARHDLVSEKKEKEE